MPVYNGERFIAEAIQSVLNQTFTDFELVIVDDGSTDRTKDTLSKFTNPRIRVLTNTENIGSAASRTKAVIESKGEYIAILDADDRMYPTRLQKQVSFLDLHPRIDMLASWVRIIDEHGKPTGLILKDRISTEKISATLLFHNIFACSSAMLRRSALPREPFRQSMMPVEDVDLWLRMLTQGSKFSILREILTEYRSHTKGISKIHANKRKGIMDKLIIGELKKLGIEPALEELELHRTNYDYVGDNPGLFLQKRERWLLKLKEANDERKNYPQKIFDEVLAERFLKSCRANQKRTRDAWSLFWDSSLSSHLNTKEQCRDIAKFILEALVSRFRR